MKPTTFALLSYTAFCAFSFALPISSAGADEPNNSYVTSGDDSSLAELMEDTLADQGELDLEANDQAPLLPRTGDYISQESGDTVTVSFAVGRTMTVVVRTAYANDVYDLRCVGSRCSGKGIRYPFRSVVLETQSADKFRLVGKDAFNSRNSDRWDEFSPKIEEREEYDKW